MCCCRRHSYRGGAAAVLYVPLFFLTQLIPSLASSLYLYITYLPYLATPKTCLPETQLKKKKINKISTTNVPTFLFPLSFVKNFLPLEQRENGCRNMQNMRLNKRMRHDSERRAGYKKERNSAWHGSSTVPTGVRV